MNNMMIVNDIAGVGKVSTNVMLPILSAALIEPAVLPTMLLSSNTEAGNMVTKSTNRIFSKFLKQWENLDYQFDTFMTGYFAEAEQIDIFKNYYLQKKKIDPSKRLFVDPIMGDQGELYLEFSHMIPERLRELIQHADIVKANITEACFLADHPYKADMNIEEVTELAKKLSKIGAKNTILTGIRNTGQREEQIGFLYYDENSRTDIILHQYFDRDFFGTGDIVFALIVAFYINDYTLHESIKEASKITENALANTLKTGRDIRYGIYFESILSSFYNKLFKK